MDLARLLASGELTRDMKGESELMSWASLRIHIAAVHQHRALPPRSAILPLALVSILQAGTWLLPSSSAATEDDATVPSMAIRDQIWSQTYKTLGVQLRGHLRRHETATPMERLGEQFNVNPREVRLFLRFAMNYSTNDMTVDKVLVRYPHYSAAALAEDLQTLASARLIQKNSGTTSYRTTKMGNQLLHEYWRLKINAATDVPEDLSTAIETLYQLLEKISGSAERMADAGVNHSIRWRRTDSARAPQDAPAVVRVYEPYSDFIAYINDNAHYRFDRFAAQTENDQWRALALSPLAKEILAAMRNGRQVEFDRCVEQPNWRQARNDCQDAFSELQVAGLVEQSDNVYQQTVLGKSYFDAAEEISNERLYRPWSVLSNAEYAAYKTALAEASRILEGL